MEHKHEVTDQDRWFYIDPAKDMAVTCEGPVKGLKRGDRGAEVYRFRMPQVIEGHDMSLCNKVEIHYNNIHKDPSTREITVNKSFAEAEGFGADQEDGDTVTWTWKPTGDATQLDGKLAFCVRFACLEGETITYQKFSGIFDAIPVGDTIHNTEEMAKAYADVLESWRQEIMAQMVTEERVRGIVTDTCIQKTETELLPETLLTTEDDPGDFFLPGVQMTAGRTYRTTINGIAHTATAAKAETAEYSVVLVGNPAYIDAGEDNGDRYALVTLQGDCMLMVDRLEDNSPASVTASIVEVEETIKPDLLPGVCLTKEIELLEYGVDLGAALSGGADVLSGTLNRPLDFMDELKTDKNVVLVFGSAAIPVQVKIRAAMVINGDKIAGLTTPATVLAFGGSLIRITFLLMPSYVSDSVDSVHYYGLIETFS